MGFLKQLRLLAHVFLNHVRVANGVFIHSGVAHLNKQPQAACQIGIMRMMEIVGFAAFDQAGRLTKVVRYARLNGNDLRSLVGITRLKQRLRHLNHLARLHELARDKALHGVLVYGRRRRLRYFLSPISFAWCSCFHVSPIFWRMLLSIKSWSVLCWFSSRYTSALFSRLSSLM